MNALWREHPDAILCSGGADGVDKWAESNWLQWGGRVLSYRVEEFAPNSWGVVLWDLGGDSPKKVKLLEEPTWFDRMSALFYRDSLIVEHSDKVVAFFARWPTSGTQTTVDFAYGADKDVYEFRAAA